MTSEDKLSITRSVFSSSIIRSSSDYIITLYEISKKVNIELMLELFPLNIIENANLCSNSKINLEFAKNRLDKLSYYELLVTKKAYDSANTFLIKNDTIFGKETSQIIFDEIEEKITYIENIIKDIS